MGNDGSRNVRTRLPSLLRAQLRRVRPALPESQAIASCEQSMPKGRMRERILGCGRRGRPVTCPPSAWGRVGATMAHVEGLRMAAVFARAADSRSRRRLARSAAAAPPASSPTDRQVGWASPAPRPSPVRQQGRGCARTSWICGRLLRRERRSWPMNCEVSKSGWPERIHVGGKAGSRMHTRAFNPDFELMCHPRMTRKARIYHRRLATHAATKVFREGCPAVVQDVTLRNMVCSCKSARRSAANGTKSCATQMALRRNWKKLCKRSVARRG